MTDQTTAVSNALEIKFYDVLFDLRPKKAAVQISRLWAMRASRGFFFL